MEQKVNSDWTDANGDAIGEDDVISEEEEIPEEFLQEIVECVGLEKEGKFVR